MAVKGPYKLRREIEPRWVAEFVSKFFPDETVAYRVPLGPIPRHLIEEHGFQKAAGIYYPSRPKVDAVVYGEVELILIEAKLDKYFDGICKLVGYRALLDVTPEMKPHLNKIVRTIFLAPIIPYWLEVVARKLNVEIVDYCPDWVRKIWEERNKYWQPEYVAERERRKQVLRRLGFE